MATLGRGVAVGVSVGSGVDVGKSVAIGVWDGSDVGSQAQPLHAMVSIIPNKPKRKSSHNASFKFGEQGLGNRDSELEDSDLIPNHESLITLLYSVPGVSLHGGINQPLLEVRCHVSVVILVIAQLGRCA